MMGFLTTLESRPEANRASRFEITQLTNSCVYLCNDMPKDVYTPIERIFPKTTEEEVKELYRSGASEEQLIFALGRLAISLAFKHAKNKDTLRKWNDIRSVALIALVKGVQKYLALDPSERDDNIGGYVSSQVHFAVKRFISEDHIIRTPSRTIRDRVSKGTYDSMNRVVCTGVSDVESANADLLSVFVNRFTRQRNIAIICTPDTDVRDVLEHVITTIGESADENRRLMELKIIGCSDEEIAVDLGRSRQWVQLRRKDIIKAVEAGLQ